MLSDVPTNEQHGEQDVQVQERSDMMSDMI